ncbi:MAG: hypothetical protein M3680_20350, partial [Myxococcota bacterium]|nr:hypothetical protein [Myxococcota bacterium]
LAATAPADPAAAKQMEPSRELSQIVNRLQWEAAHRPPTTASAERVFEALERAGVEVGAPRQYLGSAMLASYCAGGTTTEGLAISVCEFPSVEAAAAGKRFMDTKFAAMAPTARREVHATSVLSVVRPAESNDDAQLAERVGRAFTAFTEL